MNGNKSLAKVDVALVALSASWFAVAPLFGADSFSAGLVALFFVASAGIDVIAPRYRIGATLAFSWALVGVATNAPFGVNEAAIALQTSFLYLRAQNDSRQEGLSPAVIGMCAWVLLLLAVHSAHVESALVLTLRLIMFVPLAAALAKARPDEVRATLWTTLVLLILLVAGGMMDVIQFLTTDAATYASGGFLRARGPLGSANVLATTLATLMVLGGFLLVVRPFTLQVRVGGAAVLLLALTVVLFTFSRRAALALAVGAILLMAMVPRAKWSWKAVAAMGLFSIVVISIVPQDILLNPRFGTILEPTTNEPRLVQFNSLHQDISGNPLWPLFGMGVGSSFLDAKREGIPMAATIIDSQWGTLWANFGLIGVALAAAAWGTHTLRGLTRGPKHHLQRASSCALAVLMVASVTGNTMHTMPTSSLVWLLIGLEQYGRNRLSTRMQTPSTAKHQDGGPPAEQYPSTREVKT